jgi:hypothetical protein
MYAFMCMYCACGSCLLMQTLKGRFPGLRSLKQVMGDISVCPRNNTKSKSPSLPVLGARSSCPRAHTHSAVAKCLRYCATNQKVACSTPDGVMEFFIDIYPSDRTMALGSTQPLTEMSSRRISCG